MNWTNASRRTAADAILDAAPIMPVLTIERLEDAVPLARALADNGLPVLEITLRTPVAREAIALIAREVPNAIVGAGTVLRADDLRSMVDVGARFAIAPGCTDALYAAADDAPIPFIPAIATASELMRGLDAGHVRFKFFPAESAGGIAAVKSFAGPFGQVKFCPTGGIDAAKAPAYLKLPNVSTVGGSWMVPRAALDARDWATIGRLAAECTRLRDA
ncbi:bifunctional 4-hydroxy-2-oxoglutarate aldolase/2-dehydro-3-deoxy-phosphogluconate aldolase [Noviluteimonas gilva]|uniref:2-dehydro-3-deoxy-phosphogluconate aldolase n=1 Tax=Noviluteimonas gilva TaxID=2682097 RepID=A0A7C9M2Q2_9GAMM|nr:bifunctional 4-hydroxy-2-oxoglutarate aldolase/2-dehydro-3-deoxy-phosphogluconate aldolase [Lysobacter gilvus]MUV15208.1 bifunctional 4-hydroxy-2-oxoglutarate aldolase/2-dehydro-3-deoxy-phosphogluconate aldolase [Lysobacter gilvus]